MAAVDLCTFNHGLGIYIHILFLACAREKKWNINTQTMVKWAQIYCCHELFLKYNWCGNWTIICSFEFSFNSLQFDRKQFRAILCHHDFTNTYNDIVFLAPTFVDMCREINSDISSSLKPLSESLRCSGDYCNIYSLWMCIFSS